MPSTCPGDMSNVSSGSCVLTWGINPVLEPLASLLSYELAFKKQEEAWEWAQHKDHIIGVTWLILEAVELNPDSTYEARLRVQMATLEDEMAEEERYEGHWSEWSQPVCFPSPRRQGGLQAAPWESAWASPPLFAAPSQPFTSRDPSLRHHAPMTTPPWRSEGWEEEANTCPARGPWHRKSVARAGSELAQAAPEASGRAARPCAQKCWEGSPTLTAVQMVKPRGARCTPGA
uniref:Interleukin 9 receptor n=1 Tax=Molossus molossus TaxID=27622 RepID=A0A7J8IYM4_MOLMO|nr:interleukin 9 receptor [Molossus molossus]